MTSKRLNSGIVKEAPKELHPLITRMLKSASEKNESIYNYAVAQLRRRAAKDQTVNSAFWLIAHSNDPQAFSFLRDTATSRTKNIRIRRAACWALASLRHPKPVSVLLDLFKTARDPILLWESAKGLSRSQDASLADSAISALKKSSDDNRKEAAAFILGSLKGKTVVQALISTLRNRSESSNVRGQAAESLAYIRDIHSFPFLLESLEDNSAEVRFWSAFALGKLGDKRAIPALQKLAKSDTSKVPGWWSIKKEAKAAIKDLRAS